MQARPDLQSVTMPTAPLALPVSTPCRLTVACVLWHQPTFRCPEVTEQTYRKATSPAGSYHSGQCFVVPEPIEVKVYNYKPLKCVDLMKMKGPMIFLNSVWSNSMPVTSTLTGTTPGSMTVETGSLTPICPSGGGKSVKGHIHSCLEYILIPWDSVAVIKLTSTQSYQEKVTEREIFVLKTMVLFLGTSLVV